MAPIRRCGPARRLHCAHCVIRDLFHCKDKTVA